MLGRKAERPNPDTVDTVLGRGTSFHGTMTAEGSVRIDGHLDGEVTAQGDVFVGQGGEVLATVKARHVVVGGKIKGDVETEGKLEISSGGSVTGNVTVGQLVVVEGGVFEGNSTFRRGPEDQPNQSREG